MTPTPNVPHLFYFSSFSYLILLFHLIFIISFHFNFLSFIYFLTKHFVNTLNLNIPFYFLSIIYFIFPFIFTIFNWICIPLFFMVVGDILFGHGHWFFRIDLSFNTSNMLLNDQWVIHDTLRC